MPTNSEREFTVTGNHEYRPWPELRHAAAVLRKLAQSHEPGSASTAAAAVLMTAFSVEGFMQTIGPEVLNGVWTEGKKPVERMPILVKLKRIGRAVGVSVNFGVEPWKSIKELFKARDALAHPKPGKRPVNKKVIAPVDADAGDLFYAALSQKYEPLHDMEALATAAAKIDEALLRIWQASGKSSASFTVHGGSTWSASIGDEDA